MRHLDFSSLRGLITTLLSLGVITLIGVGIRLLERSIRSASDFSCSDVARKEAEVTARVGRFTVLTE